MNYRKEIANLPMPSVEQIECFKKYLLNRHSWYKHLSIESGNQFVIFPDPDLDQNFASKPVQYPFIINSKEQYLKAFGHLNYMWLDNGFWNQDGGKTKQNTPHDLINRWSITLYPYCHEEFEEAISLLRLALKGNNCSAIPNYKILVDLESKITFRDNCWNNALTDAERELLVSLDDNSNNYETSKLSLSVKKYLKLERGIWTILTKLIKSEEEKIDMLLQLVINDLKILKQNPC